MPRYYADLTQVQLFPNWPYRAAADRFPMVKARWDREVGQVMEASPRLFNRKVAAVVRRRWQELLARKRTDS